MDGTSMKPSCHPGAAVVPPEVGVAARRGGGSAGGGGAASPSAAAVCARALPVAATIASATRITCSRTDLMGVLPARKPPLYLYPVPGDFNDSRGGDISVTVFRGIGARGPRT